MTSNSQASVPVFCTATRTPSATAVAASRQAANPRPADCRARTMTPHHRPGAGPWQKRDMSSLSAGEFGEAGFEVGRVTVYHADKPGGAMRIDGIPLLLAGA